MESKWFEGVPFWKDELEDASEEWRWPPLEHVVWPEELKASIKDFHENKRNMLIVRLHPKNIIKGLQKVAFIGDEAAEIVFGPNHKSRLN